MSLFEIVEDLPQNAVIKVIGVGGGGGNAVKHMINNTIEELSGPASDPRSTYAVPDFYFLKMRSSDGAPAGVSNDYINNCDFFYSRVADYTISVCR